MIIQINYNEKNQDISSDISDISGSSIYRNIENLLTIVKSAKFKKSKLSKSKLLILSKDFAKANFRIDFLIPKVKKVFIYL